MMIVATPLFINKLGAEQYGLWMLINVLVQLINAFNFGIGESTIKAVSKNFALGQYQQMQETVNRNLFLALLLMCICLSIGLILSTVITSYDLFNIPTSLRDEAYFIIIIFSWSTGIKFIEQVFVSIFKGMQRFDISARLSMVGRLSYIFSAIVLVYFGFGLVQIAIASIIVNLLNLLLQLVVVFKKSPIYQLRPQFKQTYILHLFHDNFWYWLQSVIALFGFLSDRIILGSLANLKTVGYYSIAALIGSQIHNILLAFGGFVFPKVASYEALNKNINQIYFVSRAAIAIAGWFVIIGLTLFGDYLFRLWLGNDVFAEARVYINLYMAFIAVIILIIVPFHFINGSNKIQLNSLFEFLLRGSHLVAMYFGFNYYGVQGLIWALIITTLLNMPIQYFLFNKHILKLNGIHEAVLPVLPPLTIVILTQVNQPIYQLILLAVFGVLLWFIYIKKMGVNFKTLSLKHEKG